MQVFIDSAARWRRAGALLLIAVAGLAVAAPADDDGGGKDGKPPFMEQPLPDHALKVSEHVWAIIGFPNVAIVVGAQATLVVDTGLGRVNGATVAKVAAGLAPHNRLLLTTTHFHPEHAAGVLGFPAGTPLIRSKVQQDEMARLGKAMVRQFAGRSPLWGAWLAGPQLRAADETFVGERRLDLGGGVTARLLDVGPTHTLGDEVVFVDPDRTLVSGDVVQNKVGPNIVGAGGTPDTWIAATDRILALGARHVIPDHSPIGDGALVAQERAFLVAVRTRALAMKAEGKTWAQAAPALTAEFRSRYPDWSIPDLGGFVKGLFDGA